MNKYIPTIGLEIHAELKTKTKMFCDCPNESDARKPNTNVCPICLGHPGVLPVINKKAVEAMIKIGLAINGEISENFKFDRKNYFYPDLPKGYQISQYDMPIVKGGGLDIFSRTGKPRIVKINRAHLEEDAGKLLHSASFSASLVDFNRGGVPLMELVSEPDIHSDEEAVAYAKELQLILRYLGVSDADMERGQMRVDANISIARIGADQNADQRGKNIGENQRADQFKSVSALGTKVEVKNLNSFQAIEQAINCEIQRQREILEAGGVVKQETRGWDSVKKETISQRSKEEAHDYRYFPEPDLPPLTKSGFDVEKLKMEIPELPKEKRRRFGEQYKLSPEQMSILIEDKEMADYFEEAVSELEADEREKASAEKIKLALNYLSSDLRGLLMLSNVGFGQCKITPENFADLMDMIFKKEITSRVAKDLLVKMTESDMDPRTLVESEGLGQVSGEKELSAAVEEVLAANPKAIEDYKNGKTSALQFLVGKAMAILRGRGNPEILKSLFEKKLK